MSEIIDENDGNVKSAEQSDKYIMMTETPVRPLIMKLAVPTIISMMITGIYNSVYTYFVGKISTEATAAVGIVFSVMAVIQALGFFWGHGAGNYISRSLGAGKKKEAEEISPKNQYYYAKLYSLRKYHISSEPRMRRFRIPKPIWRLFLSVHPLPVVSLF